MKLFVFCLRMRSSFPHVPQQFHDSSPIHIIRSSSLSLPPQLGSMTYVKITFVLIALTACMQLLMTHVAVTRLGREAERHAHCVGYGADAIG